MLFTNDGTLAQALMHPSQGVTKTYEVKIKGRVLDEHLEALSAGITLEDGPTSPAEIVDYGFDSKTNTTLVEITIHEGRNRQVRRMFEHFKYSVYNLKRIAYGGLTLAGVKRGAYRKLTGDGAKGRKMPAKDNKKQFGRNGAVRGAKRRSGGGRP